MRILNIYFKNINSLAGESRINFEQGPIADSGIYAITGPNGSGKTSILDVITLGLYGETFRFVKPAEHIITEHTDESLAQVDFAFDGQKYRSSWSVKRSDADQPEMRLVRLDEPPTLLADTPNQARNYLAELIGMDFHKFCKSIMLPQGDFAAFLNALDSERMDILEKISGADFFADYQRQMTDKHNVWREKIDGLVQETQLLPVLDDETLAAAELDLQDFQDLSAELKDEITELERQRAAYRNVEQLLAQQQQLAGREQQLNDRIGQHQTALQTIERAPRASVFQDELNLLNGMQAELAEDQNRLAACRQELRALEPKLAELGGQGAPDAAAGAKTWAEQKRRIDALKLSISELKLALAGETDIPARINAQLQEKQTALAEAETWLQIHQADASLLTEFPEIAQLRNVRSELAELSGEYKKQSGWSKKITAAVSKNQARIVNAEARQQELAILIENNQKTLAELTHGKSLEELKELQDEQQTRADQFQALFETAAVHARFAEKKGLFDWFKRAQPLALPDVVALQIHLDDLKQDFASAENISMALDKAISNETLLKKLNIQRNKLIEGKPCLLCGSTHHPYTFKPPLLSDSRKALADQRNKVMVLKTMIESAEKQVANAQKQLNNADAKQKFLAEKRSEWRLLANKLNLMHENLQIEHLATQKQLLADETGELGRIKSLVNERSQLEREIVNAKDEIAAKKALAASLRLGAEQLNERHAGNTPEMDEVQAKYLQLQSNEADLSKRIEAQLKLLGEKMPSAGKENAVFDRLNGRRQDYQINEIRRNGLLEEVNDLQQKLQTCQAAILNYQQQINANLEELREEEQIGLHLSAFDKQQTVTGLEKQINDRHIALQSMQRGFAEKISAAGFDTLDELKETLQLAENQPEIAAQLADCRTQAEQIHFQRLQIDLRLQREMQDYDDSISEEDIARMQALLAEKLQIAEQEVRSLQFKLDKQQKYRAKYQSLDGELTQLRMQLAAGEEEIRQLQSEPGGMQRRNRQLLIDKLLTKANQILEKISGRYYLRSAGSEHGLALEIEDVKQKNVRRLPKTLSGGESFVVSLALALALADIANNGKTIESLFLDEGFGNLDAEALYLAMSTLERLRLQGKTVGVISHVEAVKKRIKTQITLVKNANGLSELKLVA